MPPTPDSKIEAFHLWTDTPARTSRRLRRIGFAVGITAGLAFAVIVAAALGGWI